RYIELEKSFYWKSSFHAKDVDTRYTEVWEHHYGPVTLEDFKRAYINTLRTQIKDDAVRDKVVGEVLKRMHENPESYDIQDFQRRLAEVNINYEATAAERTR